MLNKRTNMWDIKLKAIKEQDKQRNKLIDRGQQFSGYQRGRGEGGGRRGKRGSGIW